jgi:uncharacterized membrane protein
LFILLSIKTLTVIFWEKSWEEKRKKAERNKAVFFKGINKDYV